MDRKTTMMDWIENLVIVILLCIIQIFAVWIGLRSLNDLFPNLIEVTIIHVLDIWLILIAIGACINNTPTVKR